MGVRVVGPDPADEFEAAEAFARNREVAMATSGRCRK
jgi:hypothetical protein